jgi:hypothetical protein
MARFFSRRKPDVLERRPISTPEDLARQRSTYQKPDVYERPPGLPEGSQKPSTYEPPPKAASTTPPPIEEPTLKRGTRGTVKTPNTTLNGQPTPSAGKDGVRVDPKRGLLRKTGGFIRAGSKFLKVAAPIMGTYDAYSNKNLSQDQDYYFETYGGLSPIVKGAAPDPVGKTINTAAFGLFDPDIQSLARKTQAGVSNFFTEDDMRSSEVLGSPLPGTPESYSKAILARQKGVEAATARLAGPDASERDLRLARTQVRDRAEKLTASIEAGKFDYDTLDDEDKALARDFGMPVPQDTRTGIPPVQDKVNAVPSNDGRIPDDPNTNAYEGFVDPDFDPNDRYVWADEKPAADLARNTTIPTEGETFSYDTANADNEKAKAQLFAGTPDLAGGRQQVAVPVYRKLGDDGVPEYTTDPNIASQEGYTKVDGIDGSTFGPSVPAQDNMDSFPGTSAFVTGIRKDSLARQRDFASQQERARDMQANLPREARRFVERNNPLLTKALSRPVYKNNNNRNVAGAASKALNEYTLDAMRIMQDGRDAYAPESIDTVQNTLDADANDISRSQVDAYNMATLGREYDSQRDYETTGDRNANDQENIGLKRTKEFRDATNNYIDNNFVDSFDPENPTASLNKGRFEDVLKATSGNGWHSYSERERGRRMASAHFVTDVMDRVTPTGSNIDTSFLEDSDEPPMRQLLKQMATEEGIPGIQVLVDEGTWSKLVDPVGSIKTRFSINQLELPVVQIGGEKIKLKDFLNFGNGAGWKTSEAAELRNKYGRD